MALIRRLIASTSAAGTLSAALLLAMPASGAAAFVPPTPCTVGSSSQVFLPWGDTRDYALVPGGDGSLTGWTLQGGAAQVAGGPSGSSDSLSLPQGAVATAPPACVNVAFPDTRFFLQGGPGASVKVYAVYDNGQQEVSIPAGPPGTVDATSSWQPSPGLGIHPIVIPALLGGTADITLRFVGNSGTSQIDDVYIDPYGEH